LFMRKKWYVAGLMIMLAFFTLSAPGNIKADGVPVVSLSAPSEVLVGEDFSFSVDFDNTSATDPGYGPYIDLIFPVNGADGNAGNDTPDGIDFNNATYQGASVDTTVLTFPDDGGGTGCVDHPYAKTAPQTPLQVCGTTDDKLVVLRLPFGSFVPDQPETSINVSASLSELADLDTPLTIEAQGGFMFGADSLDNPSTDPSTIGSSVDTDITPSVITQSKSFNGPENETATGENYTRRYTIDIDVADGQTVDNVEVTDLLPPELEYEGFVSASPGGYSIDETPVTPGAQNPPDNDFAISWSSLTGGAGNDASVTLEVSVPKLDAGGSRVISESAGGCVNVSNNISLAGDWDPIDGRDSSTSFDIDPAGAEQTFSACSMTTQKSASIAVDNGPSGFTPGDIVEYTIDFQISDHFAFDDIVATDVFSDGMLFDGSFTPTLSVTEHGSTSSGNIDGTNYSVTHDSPGTGDSTVVFNISDELSDRLLGDGQVLGGCLPSGGGVSDCATQNNGATTGTITFRTEIQQTFTDDFPSGEPNVDQGDRMTNDVDIEGDVIDNTALTDLGGRPSESSSANFTIEDGVLSSKEVYAINGSTTFPTPVKIGPDDTVTYRLQFNMPTSDVDDLVITDYLPLPTLDATEVTTFDPTVDASVPAAGEAKYGASDTFSAFSGITPVLNTNASNNTVEFDYGDHQADPEQATVIDLLFTVTASDEPFADGLMLTNQASSVQNTTNTTETVTTEIVQVELEQPDVRITKGAVVADSANANFDPATVAPETFSAPGGGCPRFSNTIHSNDLDATPIDSDVGDVDAGDTVTFAMVVENTGDSQNGAYDVQIKDDLPSGYAVPGGGLNLCVTDGTGSSLSYSDVNAGNPGLLGDGIELDDGVNGALDAYSDTSGTNLAIVSFDLEVNGSVEPEEEIENTATLLNFAGNEGATNHVPDTETDTATTTVATHETSKTIDDTSEAHTTFVSGRERVAVGEVIRYRTETRIPEGTSNSFAIEDLLPNGLQFLNDGTAEVAFVSDNTGMTSTTMSGGGLNQSGDETTVSSVEPSFTVPGGAISGGPFGSGDNVEFDFGDLTNTADEDDNDEFIVLEFNVLVTNTSNNTSGSTKNNRYRTELNGTEVVRSSGVLANIAEPDIEVTKNITATPDNAGDPVTYQLLIENTATGANGANAYEVNVLDALNGDLTLGSVTEVSSPATTTVTDNSGATVDVDLDVLEPGGVVELQVDATVSASANAGLNVENTASAEWTSLPGGSGTTGNSTGSDTPGATGDADGERDGSDGEDNLPNKYLDTGTADFTLDVPTIDKQLLGGSGYAIGETVTFDILVDLTESTALDMVAVDQMPPGLNYDSHSIITTAAGSPLLSNDFNGPALSPTVTGGASSGDDVSFDFGDIAATDDGDSSNNAFVIQIDAIVSNVATNQLGDTPQNSAVIEYTNPNTSSTDTLTDPSSPNITIEEPVLNIDKVISSAPSPAVAGGTVEYTVDIYHNGSSTSDAYDLIFTDTIDSDLTNINVTSSTLDAAPISSEVVGQDIRVPSSGDGTVDLPQGSTIEIVFEADLTNSVTPGEDIDNTGVVTWSSLDGSDPNERTDGDSEYNQGGTNDYEKSDTTTFTSDDLSLVKTSSSTSEPGTSGSDVTIGEVVTYELELGFIEGVTEGFQFTDDIPSGMQYVSGSVGYDFSGFGPGDISGGFSVTEPTTNGGNLVVTHAADVDTSDSNTGNNSFTLTFDALVLDVPGNDGLQVTPTELTNSADVVTDYSGSDPETVTSNDVDHTVVEPDLAVTKTFTPDEAAINDTTTVSIVVTNDGTSDAYGVDLSDDISSFALTNFSNLSHDAGAAPDTLSESGGVITASWSTLAAGASSTITFDVDVDSGVSEGDTMNNTADVDGISLSTADGNERETTDSGSDVLTVTAVDLTVVKDDSQSLYEPGDILTYTITVTNNGTRDANGVEVTDTVPTNTTFDGPNSDGGWSCSDGDPAGTVCTYTIGDLDAGDSTIINFAVETDSPLTGGQSITNTASATDDGTHGPDANTADNSNSDIDTNSGDPDISAVKSYTLYEDVDGDAQVSPGDVLEYEVEISNNGGTHAEDVVFTDTPDSQTTLQAGTVSTTAGTVTTGNSGGDTTIGVDLGQIDGGGVSETVTYRVVIDSTLTAGTTHVSNRGEVAGGNFTSVYSDDPLVDDGTDCSAGFNNCSDADTGNDDPLLVPVNTLNDLGVSKQSDTSPYQEGDVMTYTITVENFGDINASGVELTETVPQFTTSGSGNSALGWSCPDGSSAGTTCTYALGGLNAGSSQTVDFIVQVDDPVPAGSNQIDNTVSVDDDGSNGLDDEPSNNSYDLTVYELSGGSTPMPPSNTLVAINGGDCVEDSPVPITLSATNATQVIVGSTPGLSDGNWMTFDGDMELDWELTGGAGVKHVYAAFRNGTGLTSPTIGDAVLYEPEGCSEPASVPEPPEDEPEDDGNGGGGPPDEPEDDDDDNEPEPEPEDKPEDEPTDDEPVEEPEEPMAEQCEADCDALTYDLYIVNPDGTERHMNTRWTEVEDIGRGVKSVRFEDKGEDFDYNDVVIRVDKQDCENVQFEALSVNAKWKHEVRVAVYYHGELQSDRRVWHDSHQGVGGDYSIDFQSMIQDCVEDKPCTASCAMLDYDLYIVNPDGTERHMNTEYTQVNEVEDGVFEVAFEDKGEDFDYNDVELLLDTRDCSAVRVELLSHNARWNHGVWLTVDAGGGQETSRFIWRNSRVDVGQSIEVDALREPAICYAEPSIIDRAQEVGVRLFEHIGFAGDREDFEGGEEDADLSDNSIGENVVSSIKTFGGYAVELFSNINFGGASQLFTDDNEDLRETAFGQDTASSLRVVEAEQIDEVSGENNCATDYEFTLFLDLEQQGQEVVELQQLLKCLGYFPQETDATGYFGPVTERAVIDFQEANGVEPLGIVGPATRDTLNTY
jgi:uncharacterized repeat protein (TIGR01451 family)/fimbrial isopeptide formation D2 family protein